MIDYGAEANAFRSGGLALKAFFFGMVLVAISTVSIRAMRVEAAFTFLPFIAVFLWPRNASRGFSGFFIFVMGLIVDILSGGPVGLWPLIYMTSYSVIRLDARMHSPELRGQWIRFMLWVLAISSVIFLVGLMFIDGRTAIRPLIMQAITGLIMFPVFYWVWRVMNSFFGERSGFGGAL